MKTKDLITKLNKGGEYYYCIVYVCVGFVRLLFFVIEISLSTKPKSEASSILSPAVAFILSYVSPSFSSYSFFLSFPILP